MTLKTHIVYHHLEDYFDWTGISLKYLNGEAVEMCHSTVRKNEETHQLKVTRHLASPMHLKKALKRHIWHNSKKAGYVPPIKFRIRSPSHSVYSSTVHSNLTNKFKYICYFHYHNIIFIYIL